MMNPYYHPVSVDDVTTAMTCPTLLLIFPLSQLISQTLVLRPSFIITD